MRLVIVISLIFSILYSTGQTTKEMCSVLETVLNNKDVNKALRMEFINDSLKLIDVYHKFKDRCDTIKWETNQVSLIHDPELIAKIKANDPYLFFRNDCKTFIIDPYKKRGKLLKFRIHQSCSGLVAEIVVRWKKQITVVSVTRLVY